MCVLLKALAMENACVLDITGLASASRVFASCGSSEGQSELKALCNVDTRQRYMQFLHCQQC